MELIRSIPFPLNLVLTSIRHKVLTKQMPALLKYENSETINEAHLLAINWLVDHNKIDHTEFLHTPYSRELIIHLITVSKR